MGTLYLVATPIGNLEDISPRALQILGQVKLVAAEDTRVTGKLLAHFDLHTPLTSYYEHNKYRKLDVVLEALKTGDVALVSDAGTPALNDPGVELVRSALAAGHAVCPIPGPSAAIAALVASGLPTDAFVYLGYLPRQTSQRCTALMQAADFPYTLIFLEAPHRLLHALSDMEAILGDRRICVARELTKVHEEIWRGTIAGARAYFTAHPPRGEFTLVVAGAAASPPIRWTQEQVQAGIQEGLEQGIPPSRLARQIAEKSGWPRRDVYRLMNKSVSHNKNP